MTGLWGRIVPGQNWCTAAIVRSAENLVTVRAVFAVSHTPRGLVDIAPAEKSFEMVQDKQSGDPVMTAALKVFTEEELRGMSVPLLLALVRLIERRLIRRGAAPSQQELTDLRDLVAAQQWPPFRDRR